MEYGQFCPIAKASEIIGEKWTILIIRELLMGSTRFNELQRGLSLISPTILSKRLNSLIEYGLVYKKKIQGQQGYAYFTSDSCQELLPVIKSLGDWGMRFAQEYLLDTDYDVELLMLYLQRSIQTDKLPAPETVVRFKFTDITEPANWWLIANHSAVDVCTSDPGREVDVYFTCAVPTMVNIWMGQLSYKKAVRQQQLKVVGPAVLTRDIFSWISPAIFADLPPAAEI